MSLLGICIVDMWLICTGAQGNRRHINQRTFYVVLGTQLADNTYDKANLRRRGSHEKVSSSKVRPGMYLERTNHKRRKLAGTFTPYPLQTLSRFCTKNKTTHLCSRCRDGNESFFWHCNTSTGRNCFAQHIRDVHE